MDSVAQAPNRERSELFRNSSADLRPERSPAILEKDFWVCWILHRIYDALEFRPRPIFKGGTSLSKAYGVIERFSEDVDLSLSRRDLGFVDTRDPEAPGISRKETRRRIDALVDACRLTITEQFVPALKADFSTVIGEHAWNVELDDVDPQTVIFTYPGSGLVAGLPTTLRPTIRLEMGARYDDWPTEDREIRPDAAHAYPDAFTAAPSCVVRVLDARRTFWEKATLLHAEYHRPPGTASPAGLSRHYYDLYQLSLGYIGEEALARLDLLERVVTHKSLFFPSAWAHYGTAVPGSVRLVPPDGRFDSLRSDYARMREMIFGDAPSWDHIVNGLHGLETRVNR